MYCSCIIFVRYSFGIFIVAGALETQFTPLPPPDSNEEGEAPSIIIYVTHRHLHYPMVHIRPAIVEDNDDLLPVLQKSSPDKLSETYGTA